MEIVKDLVSVITPCYNGEKYINRLLDSILEQSYPYLEHFIIDDGSTDGSKDIIESYIPLYRKKGYSLNYLYQDNSGQSVALNKGLKLIKGEFFVWPDSDDFYSTSSAIEELVYELKVSDEDVSCVRALIRYLDENNLKEVGATDKSLDYSLDLFEDCLFQRNFWFSAGVFMCRTEALFMNIPNKEIYTEKNAGQNWQLMLPLLYRRKCLTIKKYLYNVVVRKASHSRGQYDTLENSIIKFKSFENTIINTLNNITSMSGKEREKYKRSIYIRFQLRIINLHFEYKKNREARKLYRSLNINDKKTTARYYSSLFPLGTYIFRALIRLKLV